MKSLFNTRSIVILGYCLLVVLAITGIVTIYYEVIKSHRQSSNDSSLKKELIDLSNTLTTMYQAEGAANLLAFADNENFRQQYDSLSNRVFDQIDSLRFISIDQNISYNLDTLSSLLEKKRKNALEMLQLIKQIDKNIVQEFKKTTIITRTDIDKLNTLIANVTHTLEDTVQIVAEKKSLFQRLKAVVNPNSQDTLTQIAKGSISETTDLISPIIVDSIVDFIKKLDNQKQLKNVKIINQLIIHQHELYTINELTGLQINRIMDALKDRDYQTNMIFLEEKNESLKRSSSLVAIVGFSALIIAVFFMSWILHSLNKAQHLQKNIQEAKKHAEILLKSREQLIYTITHDIKAPLSSIIGFLELMSEDTLSQKHKYYADNMYSSASHILNLVRNLLDFHAIEKEQPQLTNFAFLPSALIYNIYESFLPLTQKKKLEFELNSNLEDTKTFLSDPYYIRQIVNNLLTNAIKFTQEHGHIYLTTSLDDQNQWTISVKDTGPGIDAADQAKIFEEFIRLDKQNNEVEGTGLGLTISKKIAALLGGTIKLESQKGVGSIFTLTVPLTPLTDEAVFQPEKIINVSAGRILFIDDDRSQLNLLSELMKKEGLSCRCCSNAYEALDLLREQSFDVIFTDINISDMNGFELMKQIKDKNTMVPVISLSANYEHSEFELKEAGFDGFLHKPFNVHQLLEIIEKYTSFKQKISDAYSENYEYGWQELMDFISNDREASLKIINSFIEETNKDRELLKIAFQKKSNEDIKQISHKMLSLMRVISAQDIVSILTDFEKGEISDEKKLTLFYLIDEKIAEMETKRQILEAKEEIMNYEL